MHDDFLKEYSIGKEQQNFSVEKDDKHDLDQAIEVITRVVTHVDSMHTSWDVVQWLIVFLLETQSPCLIMKKTSDKFKLRVTLDNT